MNRIAVLQFMIIGACAGVVISVAASFPYPSPMVKPLLPPQKRWPAPQVREWLQSGEFDPAFLSFFYRDPERSVPPGANIVAPADGVLRAVVESAGTVYVNIALSFWDVHVQRAPARGQIVEVREAGSAFMDGEGDRMVFLKRKNAPVQKIVTIRTEWGEMRVRLITSLSARRIEVWKEKGDTVEKGERFGRILLGSTVVLEMPAELPVELREGQRLTAGETIVSKGTAGS